MSWLVIDGAQGEGGGQVLRTAMTLSVLTQTPIEVINIRANRNKPGLLRQHLTSVNAAREICNGTLEGGVLGSSRIKFSPGKVKSGDYHFVIGTAGSTVLVCQTILPLLALADSPSRVTFEGGTHNGMSPSLCFFNESYLPVLKAMGLNCRVQISSLGFYPAGGGKWQLTVEPTMSLKPVELLTSVEAVGQIQKQGHLSALMSALPDVIGQKEVTEARKLLGWDEATADVLRFKTNGPGNSFQVKIKGALHTSLFEQVGQFGVSAERVAKRCVGRVKKFLKAEVAVEQHLADQLLVPMALAGGGQFTTTQPSLHMTTNIDVIKQFLSIDINVVEVDSGFWQVKVG
ncbi:RNA 3'-terminal phosphate cyclase [Motilimonas eburnea]|uniref:RNA 3'-terminal phosphate cyclase n=1 Tax=Motilimonas eburnea TaxID=1737488 RepID=UPI001E425FAF|nr:RNA 3'-terminal phosphate cyclase [Motilimonas eburnea]MCE2572293.1 RNA 3'-terminal phosphate cyclase [Motilimonas eburnea]